MNICLLTMEWPNYGGGIGTYMFNLAKGLKEYGHKVTVITHNNEPVKIDGVEMKSVPVVNGNGSLKNKVMRWRWEPHYSWSANAFRHFTTIKDSFDIIETAEYGAWARHFIGHSNVPIVVRCHTPAKDVQEIGSNGGSNNIPLWLKNEDRYERIQTRKAPAISAPGYMLSNHISLNWSIPINKIKVLPNPVDTDLFRPSTTLIKRKEILYTGRLQYNKGVFDLIDAVIPILKEHPDLTIRLIGKDLKTPKCLNSSFKMASEEIISRVPLENRKQVILAGWVSIQELIACQQQAMCAVVPSRGFESFSYTLTEHMACGTAVVATHCGGPTEIINNGEDGIIVPAGDVDALTVAIRKLINDPKLCFELGIRARKKVEEKYAISMVVPAIAQWYEQIIRNYQNDKLCHSNI
ncbi:MAG: glycosyltransferase family 4 protein [Phycisphaerales bacterium]